MKPRSKILKTFLDQLEAFFYALIGGLTGWGFTPSGKSFSQIFAEWKSKQSNKSKIE